MSINRIAFAALLASMTLCHSARAEQVLLKCLRTGGFEAAGGLTELPDVIFLTIDFDNKTLALSETGQGDWKIYKNASVTNDTISLHGVIHTDALGLKGPEEVYSISRTTGVFTSMTTRGGLTMDAFQCAKAPSKAF